MQVNQYSHSRSSTRRCRQTERQTIIIIMMLLVGSGELWGGWCVGLRRWCMILSLIDVTLRTGLWLSMFLSSQPAHMTCMHALIHTTLHPSPLLLLLLLIIWSHTCYDARSTYLGSLSLASAASRAPACAWLPRIALLEEWHRHLSAKKETIKQRKNNDEG